MSFRFDGKHNSLTFPSLKFLHYHNWKEIWFSCHFFALKFFMKLISNSKNKIYIQKVKNTNQFSSFFHSWMENCFSILCFTSFIQFICGKNVFFCPHVFRVSLTLSHQILFEWSTWFEKCFKGTYISRNFSTESDPKNGCYREEGKVWK